MGKTIMTKEIAERTGVLAFQGGKPMPPALNNAFIEAACHSPIKTVALLDAYIHGWTVASLAEREMDELLPSRKELTRIMG